MEIKGKSAIVTGAASGIGRATAVLLAQHGVAHVALADVNVAGLEETARQVSALGAQAGVHRLDLADMAAVEAWFRNHGDVDILHNNAGVVSGEPQFPEVDVDRLRWIVDVNLTSLITATQIVSQAMRARGGGVIVNTVSTVALGTGFYDVMYATTKAGVLMFTTACAMLKDRWNVRVAGVLPGLTETPIHDTTGANGKSDWMKAVLASNESCRPEDIAEGVIDLIADDGLPGGDWVAIRRIDGRIEREWAHDRPA